MDDVQPVLGIFNLVMGVIACMFFLVVTFGKDYGVKNNRFASMILTGTIAVGNIVAGILGVMGIL